MINPIEPQAPGSGVRHMGLFPTMGSLQEVIQYAEAKLPINSKNEVVALLMTYHNTLLAQCQSNKKAP